MLKFCDFCDAGRDQSRLNSRFFWQLQRNQKTWIDAVGRFLGQLRILAPGSFAILRQRQLQKGIPDSQLKFPHLSEDRHFLEGLTVLQEFQLQEVA